jgi:hypothetical protein
MNRSINIYKKRKRQKKRVLTDLEDPLVDDDDGDVEAPPLEDGEHRPDGGGVPHLAVLHLGMGGAGASLFCSSVYIYVYLSSILW